MEQLEDILLLVTGAMIPSAGILTFLHWTSNESVRKSFFEAPCRVAYRKKMKRRYWWYGVFFTLCAFALHWWAQVFVSL